MERSALPRPTARAPQTTRAREASRVVARSLGGVALLAMIALDASWAATGDRAQAPARAPDVAPAAAAPAAATSASSVENAVVKVMSTMVRPDLFKPWARQAPTDVTGTGVVIDGKRILTNAHVVVYSSQILVESSQGGDKLSASVEALAPGIDLAVLRLEDEKFFDAHPALPRSAALPGNKDSVLVYGFPTGGSNLSITKGIVSRLEFTPYNYPVAGLRIQIDAAINPGNSGGPAVVDGKMVGIAFSHLGGADNIGYIIPAEEIDLFLADIADGRYDGKPLLLDEMRTLENPT